MKLHILSDLHLTSEGYSIPDDIEFDVLVVAGDVSNYGADAVRWLAHEEINRGKPVLYVPGNHEFYSLCMPTTFLGMSVAADETPVEVLDRRELVIDGVRFLGCTLWTDFNLAINGERDQGQGMRVSSIFVADFSMINPTDNDLVYLKPEDTVAFHQRDLAWLRAALARPFDGPTVVVTHHAPNRGSLSHQWEGDWCSTAFVSELPDECFAGADLWVHGHTHTAFDYQVAGCRVICNPRGYVRGYGNSEQTGFDPRLVVEV